jgi:hypothetical protein
LRNTREKDRGKKKKEEKHPRKIIKQTPTPKDGHHEVQRKGTETCYK